MATVRVPVAWIAQGSLPAMCARHERPATRWSDRKFYSRTPVWAVALAVFGLLIAALVAQAIRKTVEGRLPACEQCDTDRRRFVGIVLGAWAADVLLLVASVAGHSGGLLMLWLLATVVALVVSFTGDRDRVSGYVSMDEHWVDLKGASDGFTTAINQALHVPAHLYAPATAAAQAPVSTTASTGLVVSAYNTQQVAPRTILPGS